MYLIFNLRLTSLICFKLSHRTFCASAFSNLRNHMCSSDVHAQESGYLYGCVLNRLIAVTCLLGSMTDGIKQKRTRLCKKQWISLSLGGPVSLSKSFSSKELLAGTQTSDQAALFKTYVGPAFRILIATKTRAACLRTQKQIRPHGCADIKRL